jgi:hypothetical protein
MVANRGFWQKDVGRLFVSFFVPARRLVNFAIRAYVASKYGGSDTFRISACNADKGDNVVVSRRLK